MPLGSAKSATILEVARFAGVSPSTVSNVLNGKKHRTSAKTQQRVVKAVRRLGYAPNRMARGLKTGFVSIIGLIVPSVENPFWGTLARCVERVAMARNCQVMLCNSERDTAREQLYAQAMLSLGIHGLILGSSPLSARQIGKLERSGMKIVVFDRAIKSMDGIRSDSVRVDNGNGISLAVQHLLDLGHRRVGFVSGPIDSANRKARLEAYQQAMRRNGIEPDPAWSWLEEHARHTGAQIESLNIGRGGVMRLLERPNPPTGFVTVNDIIALGVIAGVHEKGLRVPRDISVVGFDDTFIGNLSNPRLTTVHQPVAALAESAVNALIGRMDGTNTAPPMRFSLPAELVVRDSTGPAPEG